MKEFQINEKIKVPTLKKGVFNFKILKTEIFNNFKHFSVLNLNTV